LIERKSNTVLIVDDDSDIRHALRLTFEWEQFEVVAEACDGIEAVRLAAQLRPAFVILDYYMPRMNGHKTSKLLREVAPGTKIVAFSSVLEQKPRWADAFLNKEGISAAPVVLKELLV